MDNKNYKPFFLVTIIITLLIVAMQLYWNFEMFASNKSQYVFKVEKAFEDAIETYYFELGKSDVLTILDTDFTNKNDSLSGVQFLNKNPLKEMSTFFKKNSNTESIDFREIIDSSQTENNFLLVTGKSAMDDNVLAELKFNNITVTQTRDSIDFKLLRKITDSIFLKEKIKSIYNVLHYKKDTIFGSDIVLTNKTGLIEYSSTSNYIPNLQNLELEFNNTEKQAFFKSLTGIILSLILSLGILFSIYYLIKTINKQKQLSKIKDDFISNITHEFKTPIATVSAAIEALGSFNVIQDKEKTNTYLTISNQQLKKLDVMVEKLLETSALDENNVKLNKHVVDIVPLIEKLLTKYELITNTKEFKLNTNVSSLKLKVDSFYFSSAISNLLDNAEKYGGRKIEVKITQNVNSTNISIRDNGNSLNQTDSSYIFDKFSRKATGNNHDVAGSGIGLYFSKKVIEKHGGTITLKVMEDFTEFIITI